MGLGPSPEVEMRGFSAFDAVQIEGEKMITRMSPQQADAESIVGTEFAQGLEQAGSGLDSEGRYGFKDPITGGRYASFELWQKYGFKPQPEGVPFLVGRSVKVKVGGV